MSELPDKMTNGELYGPAMEIQTQAEADDYFAQMVRRAQRMFAKSKEKAESDERQNLGYWAGYYNSETRARVERLFRCCHPVFGAIADGEPTAEEAFEMGLKWGSS